MIEPFSLTPPGKVLDVGCGLGLHLNAFGRCGFTGIGIDVSDYIIQEATNNCKAFGQCQIMKMRGSDIEWKNEFDLVYSLAVPLGFMDEDELQVHLKKMWAAVKVDGVFLIHVPYMLGLGRNDMTVNKWEVSDGKYTLTDIYVSSITKLNASIVLSSILTRIESMSGLKNNGTIRDLKFWTY